MPNWTENQLTVTGPEAEVKKFVKAARKKNEDGKWDEFRISALHPDPVEMGLVGKGMKNLYGKSCDDWINDGPVFGSANIPKGAIKLLDEMYGAHDWYEWHCQNWGTKWDATGSLESRSDGYAQYNFQTAWCMPTPFIDFIRDKFPKLEFLVNYQNEEDGFEENFTY